MRLIGCGSPLVVPAIRMGKISYSRENLGLFMTRSALRVTRVPSD